MKLVESAGITDIGLKRKNNEDDLFMDDEKGVYLVSDGMGGHNAGEVASAMVVELVSGCMEEYRCGKRVVLPEYYDDTLSCEGNWLKSSIRLANTGVFRAALKKEACRGMGATVAAVCFARNTLIVANVGDSLIYRIRGNTVELISVEHTVHAEFNGQGRALGGNFKHVLTRAMGVGSSVKPDICELPFFSGDVIVLCSDGLSDKVTPDEICEVVAETSVHDSGRRLVEMAKRRGGEDNITVILIRIDRSDARRNVFVDLIFRAGEFLRSAFHLRQVKWTGKAGVLLPDTAAGSYGKLSRE